MTSVFLWSCAFGTNFRAKLSFVCACLTVCVACVYMCLCACIVRLRAVPVCTCVHYTLIPVVTLTLVQITNAFTKIDSFVATQQYSHRADEPFFEFFEKLRRTIQELLEDVQKAPSAISNAHDGEGEGGGNSNMAAWSALKRRKAQMKTSINGKFCF
jgi:hypothetical protein